MRSGRRAAVAGDGGGERPKFRRGRAPRRERVGELRAQPTGNAEPRLDLVPDLDGGSREPRRRRERL